MAEMQTDAAALSAASAEIDGITTFFLFEDGSAESRAGMQDTEKHVGGMFAMAGDAGGQTVQKLAGIWGGSGSEAYLQTQQRWDSVLELNTISENINRSGTQYQSAADDAASSLQGSMGFTPPDDGFDFKAADTGEAASDSLKYNFGGIEGAASAVQPATMAEWALLLA
jgi:early secretory antigenic target protein ESAT-6